MAMAQVTFGNVQVVHEGPELGMVVHIHARETDHTSGICQDEDMLVGLRSAESRTPIRQAIGVALRFKIVILQRATIREAPAICVKLGDRESVGICCRP